MVVYRFCTEMTVHSSLYNHSFQNVLNCNYFTSKVQVSILHGSFDWSPNLLARFMCMLQAFIWLDTNQGLQISLTNPGLRKRKYFGDKIMKKSRPKPYESLLDQLEIFFFEKSEIPETINPFSADFFKFFFITSVILVSII